MDQCRLLSWEVHDAWVHQLFKTLSQTAPPGYQQVKVEQLIRADRELWTLVAQEYKGNLKPDAAGVIPLDAEIRRFCHDPRITMFLLPATGASRSTDKYPITTEEDGGITSSSSSEEHKQETKDQGGEELPR